VIVDNYRSVFGSSVSQIDEAIHSALSASSSKRCFPSLRPNGGLGDRLGWEYPQQWEAHSLADLKLPQYHSQMRMKRSGP
jgi:hypothetical protein